MSETTGQPSRRPKSPKTKARPEQTATSRFAAARSTICPPVRTSKKVRVQVSFAGRVLCSPQLEIAPLETGDEEFVTVPGSSLAAVGLDGPDLVLVLAERWQIAQKLHAVTEQFPDDRENPRFRDLIDLQLLEALAPDPVLVREACERVFAARATPVAADPRRAAELERRVRGDGGSTRVRGGRCRSSGACRAVIHRADRHCLALRSRPNATRHRPRIPATRWRSATPSRR